MLTTWPFMPQRIHQEALEWMTDVIRAKAKEQRICLREAPRHAYELHYLMDAQQFVRAKLIARANPQVNAPLWDDMLRIDAGIAYLEPIVRECETVNDFNVAVEISTATTSPRNYQGVRNNLLSGQGLGVGFLSKVLPMVK